MSKQHGARQQKRLAKQKAKRDARRKVLARQTSNNPMIRLKAADHWPVAHALVPEELWEGGLGQLVLARRMPDDQLACGIFLVDVFCLGVKNAFWHIFNEHEFKELLERIEEHGGPLKSISPEAFAKIVIGAVAYADSLGFAPHSDYRHVRLLLAGIDPSRCGEEFQFGKDGKPYYVRGPHESLDRARSIATRVHDLGGDYTIPLGPALPDDLELIEYIESEADESDDDVP